MAENDKFGIPSISHSSLVTIIIPVFNGANYLAEAIDSALAQTWPSLEVLVVDDGSTDDGRTRAIAESYGDRIRLISKSNGGVGSALNAGIAAMRGDWFSWLSHDDLYHPEKISRQMRALGGEPPGSIAFSDYKLVNESGSDIGSGRNARDFDVDRPLWAILEGLINGCTILAPRALLIAAGGFDPGLPTTQDYELWFRLVRSHRLVHVPGILVSQRTHAGQGSQTSRHIEEAGLLWAEMLERVTPAEMTSHAGSELAFLFRAEKFLLSSGYPAGHAAARRLLRARLLKTKITLVWCTAFPSLPIGITTVLHVAGLYAVACVVADFATDASISIDLRNAIPDSTAHVKLEPADGFAGVLAAAMSVDHGDLVLLADNTTILDAIGLTQGMNAICAGICDGWLQTAVTAEGGALPAAFRGALLTRKAISDTLDRCRALGGRDAATALGLVARLAHAPGPPGIPVVETSGDVVLIEPTPAPVPAALPEAQRQPASPSPHPALADTSAGIWLLDHADRLRRHKPDVFRAVRPAVTAIFGARHLVNGTAYLAANPDVAAAGVDPLLHYLRHGWREGRTAQPPLPAPAAIASPTSSPPVDSAHLLPPIDPAPLTPAPVADAAPPTWLLIIHTHGGGVLRYAELVAAHLRRNGIRPLFAWGLEDHALSVSSTAEHHAAARFDFTAGTGEAISYLRSQGVVRVDVLHTIGLEQHISALLEGLGVPYDVTFLDYYLISTSPHLLDAHDMTAALGQDGETRALMPMLHPLPAWVSGAARHLACSRDLAARLERLCPGLKVMPVRPPEPSRPEAYRVTPCVPLDPSAPLRVLTFGALASHKGRSEILAVATEAHRRGLGHRLEFHHIGVGMPLITPTEQVAAALQVHGRFQRENLTTIVCKIRPHLVWLPIRAAETYSFALSEAMLMGLPILARGLGAYPERLAGRPFTWVTPAEETSCAFWIDQLLALRASNLSLPAVAPTPTGLPPLVADFYDAQYITFDQA